MKKQRKSRKAKTSKFFDFDSDIDDSREHLEKLHRKVKKSKKSVEKCGNELESMGKELKEISSIASVPRIVHTDNKKVAREFEWEDDFFLNQNPIILESMVRKEIFEKPALLPPLTKLEYVLVGLTGSIASIIDFMVVRVPKDMVYMAEFRQKGSGFTKWLKSLGINEEGKLNPFLNWTEKTCKVPYDLSINKSIPGFNPKTHRLLNLSHDPLFGLIFGVFDILNGSMTAIDITGKIHILKTYDLFLGDKIFAPLLWLGHIVSDICTSMGIPIPGWGFLQLMRFGSFGPRDRTIADISRFMYLKGYDLRHFITMSIPVAVIEIIIRAYHYISSLSDKKSVRPKLGNTILDSDLERVQNNLKLHKMLFIAHSIAASGNAIKVFSYGGNPLAINLPQWIMFIKESIKISKGLLRDKTPEMIDRNRKIIDEEWDNIKNISIGKTKFLPEATECYGRVFKSS